MGKNLFKTLIESVTIHHDYVPATKALDLNIRADPYHLKSLGMMGARMRPFHLDLIVQR